MAIRNNKLGGSDFVNGEVLYDYDLDDTNNALIDIAAKGVAQNAYQTLKNAGTFDNKDNLGADRFTDVDGVNNTINTGSSTAEHNTDHYILSIGTDEASGDTTHDPSSYTSPSNAFDGDDSTHATKSNTSSSSLISQLGKTFVAKTIKKVQFKASASSSSGAGNYFQEIKLQSYDGTSWNDETTLASTTSSSLSTEGTYLIDKSVQGLRLHFKSNASANVNNTHKVFTLAYSQNYSSSSKVVCGSNLKTLIGDESGLCVYSDKVNTTNTNITYNVSDGTTTISDLDLNTFNGITSLGGGQLEITFNLSTTDTSETPELYGYSYYIL